MDARDSRKAPYADKSRSAGVHRHFGGEPVGVGVGVGVGEGVGVGVSPG